MVEKPRDHRPEKNPEAKVSFWGHQAASISPKSSEANPNKSAKSFKGIIPCRKKTNMTTTLIADHAPMMVVPKMHALDASNAPVQCQTLPTDPTNTQGHAVRCPSGRETRTDEPRRQKKTKANKNPAPKSCRDRAHVIPHSEPATNA